MYQFSQTPSTSLSSFAMKTFPFLSDSDVDEKLSYLQLGLLFETRSGFEVLPVSFSFTLARQRSHVNLLERKRKIESNFSLVE